MGLDGEKAGEKHLEWKKWQIAKQQEFRFEVAENSEVSIRLDKGKAEVFGSELVEGNTYKFRYGFSYSIYSHYGCALQVQGAVDVSYCSTESVINVYLNLHAALEMSRKSSQEDSHGPRCMLVGPSDVGKSTLCRLLVNYAVRSGSEPIYVDLDVGQQSIGIKGFMGAASVERQLDYDEGFFDAIPLLYHFGCKSPNDNEQLYNLIIANLSEAVKLRSEKRRKLIDGVYHQGGVIINTCSWVRGGGYQSLLHAASLFEVDLVVVLDNERLYTQLTNDLSSTASSLCRVIMLPKSGGVVERTPDIRSFQTDYRITQYFYGGRMKLHPQSVELNFSEIRLFKIGDTVLPDSLVPIGLQADDSHTRVVRVKPTSSLLHRILSISYATDADSILMSNVAGFMVVSSVNMERQTVTVLSPAPKPFPNNILLVSDIAFIDQKMTFAPSS